MAGNQLGKTLAGGFEAAIHATGRYPQWWQGKRFDRPTIGWACGVTGEVVRDTVQRVLVGRPGQTGTGAIPKDAIAELVSARGIPDLLDSIKVTHVSGSQSVIGLKSYLSGREKFQGETLSWVWLDEEPPMDIYSEALTRTNIGANPVWMTFTPLLGMSEVVRRFLQERSDARHITSMTIDDVRHIPKKRRTRSLQVIRPMNWKHAQREFQPWDLGGYFRFPNTRWQSSSRSFQPIGQRSAEWISAGITRLRP